VHTPPKNLNYKNPTLSSPLYNSTIRRAFGTEISVNQGRGVELSMDIRSSILAAVEAGKSKASIAKEFGCTRRTVYNTISRYESTGNTQSLPRPGRPKVTTRCQKRKLIRIAKAYPRIKLDTLKNEVETECHTRTVYNILREQGIRNRRAKKRPDITEQDAV
jgi:transposase